MSFDDVESRLVDAFVAALSARADAEGDEGEDDGHPARWHRRCQGIAAAIAQLGLVDEVRAHLEDDPNGGRSLTYLRPAAPSTA